MRTLFTWPSRRGAAWTLVALWLVAAAVAGPLAGRLGDVQKNDASSFLPSDAESTLAREELAAFPGGDATPAVVVYAGRRPMTPAQRAAVQRSYGAIDHLARTGGIPAFVAAAPAAASADAGSGTAGDRQGGGRGGVGDGSSDAGVAASGGHGGPRIAFASPAGTRLRPAVISADGRAIVFSVPLSGSADATKLQSAVERLRAVTDRPPAGLVGYVTGPAGVLEDSFAAFQGIDGTLLVAAVLVVAVLLLLIYRSPVLWLVPLVCVGFAVVVAQGAVYLLARHAGLTVNGQSAGILTVLVFGAGTDYALLLVARYREELRRHEHPRDAMAYALRQASPAVVASASTVVLGLLCLLAAELNSDRGLGPVGAVGIVAAFLAQVTLLPAVLVLVGRRVFWPAVPRFGGDHAVTAGGWGRIGARIARRPRAVWLVTSVLLAGLAVGVVSLRVPLPQDDAFRGQPDSIAGQHLVEQHFAAGASAPVDIVTGRAALPAVLRVTRAAAGVADARVVAVAGSRGHVQATLSATPGSASAYDTVRALRDRLADVPGAHALVGGNDATNLDVADAAARDRDVVIPLVLAVVLVVLGLLLRAVVAPVLLILTVVLSFAAALGVSALVFRYALGFAGSDTSLPLIAFIFLVALGVDYNIFLMSRAHEEAARRGTRDGMAFALAVTGGVITSAGVVLAATFAVLTVLPLVALIQVGFVVAFGVLLDTLVVRSILVPALTLDIGERVWWPSALAAQSRSRVGNTVSTTEPSSRRSTT